MNPRSTTGLFTHHGGIAIEVSKPAAKLIRDQNVPEFVRILTELMDALGAKQAYVSKRGAAVDIHILGPKGWTFPTQLKRGP